MKVRRVSYCHIAIVFAERTLSFVCIPFPVMSEKKYLQLNDLNAYKLVFHVSVSFWAPFCYVWKKFGIFVFPLLVSSREYVPLSFLKGFRQSVKGVSLFRRIQAESQHSAVWKLWNPWIVFNLPSSWLLRLSMMFVVLVQGTLYQFRALTYAVSSSAWVKIWFMTAILIVSSWCLGERQRMRASRRSLPSVCTWKMCCSISLKKRT